MKCKHLQIVTFLTLLCLQVANDKLHCPTARRALVNNNNENNNNNNLELHNTSSLQSASEDIKLMGLSSFCTGGLFKFLLLSLVSVMYIQVSSCNK